MNDLRKIVSFFLPNNFPNHYITTISLRKTNTEKSYFHGLFTVITDYRRLSFDLQFETVFPDLKISSRKSVFV